MTRKERKLLILMLLTAALVVAVEALPRLHRAWSGELAAASIALRQLEQYRGLPAKEPFWRRKHQEMSALREKLRAGLLGGESANLVSARLQGEIKRIAGESGINIASMSLPEISRTREWLLVGQTITFQARPEEVRAFANRLKEGVHNLPIIESVLRAGPTGLHCTMKIVGFSRPGQEQPGKSKP